MASSDLKWPFYASRTISAVTKLLVFLDSVFTIDRFKLFAVGHNLLWQLVLHVYMF